LETAGDLKGAFEAVEFARSVDTADRYLNQNAVKYALKNNMIEEADCRIKEFMNKEEDNEK